MSAPTHGLLDADGNLVGTVFPDGYDPALLVDLPAAYYDRPMIYAAGAFVDDVDGERARLIDVAKADWAIARAAPIDVPGIGSVQTDAGVVAVLTGGLAGAAAAKAFGLTFPALKLLLLDNTTRMLDAAGVIAVATTVSAAIQAVADTYSAKRAALEATTTLEGLWAIVPREAS